MTDHIELVPIYSKGNANLQNVNIQSDLPDDISSSSEYLDQPHIVYEPIQKQKKSCQIMRCCCLSIGALALLYIVTVLALTAYAGFAIHKCLNPNFNHDSIEHFSPEEITKLDLSVVSGTIHISSCPHVKNATIFIRRSAKTAAALEAVKTKVTREKGMISVNSVSPTFSCSHCQHSHIEVILPMNSKSLEVYANTIFGGIKVNGRQTQFNTLKLSATAGLIRLHDVNVENLDINSNVGIIALHGITTINSRVFTQFGSVCAHAFSSLVSTIEVTFGSVFAEHIGANTLSITSQLGKVYVTELHSTNEFTASVDYGFLTVKPASSFQGSFRVATEHGTAVINTDVIPSGDNGNVVVGKFQDDAKDSIDLKSTYAIVRLSFHQPEKKHEKEPKPEKNDHILDPNQMYDDGVKQDQKTERKDHILDLDNLDKIKDQKSSTHPHKPKHHKGNHHKKNKKN